jgi:hypothetical protein
VPVVEWLNAIAALKWRCREAGRIPTGGKRIVRNDTDIASSGCHCVVREIDDSSREWGINEIESKEPNNGQAKHER